MRQIEEISALKLSDFLGVNATRNVGLALAGLAWLYFTEGNMLLLGVGYMLYKRQGAARVQAAEGAAGARAPAVD